MKHTFLALAAIATLGLTTSCKKDKQDEKPKTKVELLTQGSWNVVKYHEVTYFNDTLYEDETYPGEGEKLKFNTDYTATFTDSDGETDVSSWILNDNTLLMADGEFTIQTLTESQLNLYMKEEGTEPGMGSYKFEYTI